MNAVPSAVPLEREHDAGEALPLRARVFFWLVALATLLVAGPLFPRLGHTHGWWSFVLLGGAASIAQLFSTRTPRDQSYHSATLFLIVGVLLLPPELVILLAVLQHIPEWLRVRYRWYVQSFNICNYALATLAAWGAARLATTLGPAGQPQLRLALAGTVASIVLVTLNHSLLALMLRLARGHSMRESGLFDLENVSAELVVAALGVAVFAFWTDGRWLIPFAVAPLVLIHRSLRVPQLQAEARVDPKTGLFNARYFASELAEELGRARRFGRPLSLIMADLDLLRDINNTYGHLAGDAVLQGIAEVFRAQLRHYDVPARFGGEEFSILLPETAEEQALDIAERIRRAVAEREVDVETSSEPIRATVSIGVAAYPAHGVDANELIHQADLAVYRAKLQGRNRVLAASAEPLLLASDRPHRLATVPEEGEHIAPLPPPAEATPQVERRNRRPQTVPGARFLHLSQRLAALVSIVGAGGVGAGVAGLLFGSSSDVPGLVAVVLLVGAGQALALEVDDASISVSAVGALAGAALFGPRAALAIALTTAAVEWSARRVALHHVVFNVGALTLAALAAVATIDLVELGWGRHDLLTLLAGVLAGGAYFLVYMGLVSYASALEGRTPWLVVLRERFGWLLPHYLVYGLFGSAMALAYEAKGVLALLVFTVPLLIMRKTQETYLEHTQRNAQKLRVAADTIQTQNVSLEQANRLLRERSTAAMESLSATVDARDSYTAGHSRRVQQLALAVGRELDLSQAELDLLGHAALFHDIGKLAIPDAILLKPASLTDEEWQLMREHADEGARIIDRLGFLDDAVPAIRHHHERFDGSGYPDRLRGEEIPLGARIIHVADALDSMLTTRIYRSARPAPEALAELRRHAGTQFCPRCVTAMQRILPVEPAEPGRNDVRPEVLAS